jgi:hypothetical protein
VGEHIRKIKRNNPRGSARLVLLLPQDSLGWPCLVPRPSSRVPTSNCVSLCRQPPDIPLCPSSLTLFFFFFSTPLLDVCVCVCVATSFSHWQHVLDITQTHTQWKKDTKASGNECLFTNWKKIYLHKRNSFFHAPKRHSITIGYSSDLDLFSVTCKWLNYQCEYYRIKPDCE